VEGMKQTNSIPKWARQRARELSRKRNREYYIIYEGGEYEVVSESNYDDWSYGAQILTSYIDGLEA